MKINVQGKILIISLIIISTFDFYSCSCSCTESQTQISEQVLNRSNHFIISKVGKDYFDKYIKPDFQETKKFSRILIWFTALKYLTNPMSILK